ncbi:uncharacterized protein LOC131168398 [Malania oleifera]|uniref:uncharacterized protein LOC131168398 n=1 Tax=Malania oleifera TaxID=397392 RepID=UPI0025AE0C20|nr:uncharacterized protein LOC131168398 [Malania oleifera]
MKNTAGFHSPPPTFLPESIFHRSIVGTTSGVSGANFWIRLSKHHFKGSGESCRHRFGVPAGVVSRNQDRSMGATLLRGKCQDGVYPMPITSLATKSSVLPLVGERTTSNT